MRLAVTLIQRVLVETMRRERVGTNRTTSSSLPWKPYPLLHSTRTADQSSPDIRSSASVLLEAPVERGVELKEAEFVL